MTCTWPLYIYPLNSSFSSDQDPFSTLLNDIVKFSSLGGKCILMGDMNAYTNTAPDFVVTDDDDTHAPLPGNYVADSFMDRCNRDSRAQNANG